MKGPDCAPDLRSSQHYWTIADVMFVTVQLFFNAYWLTCAQSWIKQRVAAGLQISFGVNAAEGL